ncbi:hypothetical protein D3C71_19820 [compost metagenome]
MQCKDIPTLDVLQFLEFCSTAAFKECGQWGSSLMNKDGQPFENSVQQAMPAGVPRKLVQAKMGSLIRRGLVDGCVCGCRGDFELTSRGRETVAASRLAAPAPVL